jgi:long-chain acyl-CoA synthetase
MLGYWKMPEETGKAIRSDGWVKSGDADSLDADGYLSIHDRVKDMIASHFGKATPAEFVDSGRIESFPPMGRGPC